MRSKNLVNRKIFEIHALIITAYLFVFRGAVPFFKYPFIALVILSIVYFLLRYYKEVYIASKKFIRDYQVVVILLVIVILAFLFSNKYYLVVAKDILNSIILLAFFYLFYLTGYSLVKLKFIYQSLLKITLLFSILISIILISRFFYRFTEGFESDPNAVIDYNFSTIPVLFGLILLIVQKTERIAFQEKIVKTLILLLLTFTLIISGSRRAEILFLMILLFILVCNILFYFWKNLLIIQIRNSTIRYLSFLVISTVLFIFLFFQVFSESAKYSLLGNLGVSDQFNAKLRIANIFYRYTLINKNESLLSFCDRFWSHNYDPCNPDSGWGIRNHKSVDLKGLSDTMNISDDCKGYYMDKSCNASTWDGNAYSFTRVGYVEVKPGDSLMFSANCYVSEDFNGDWARIRVECKSTPANKFDYDMKNRGSWQELSLKFSFHQKDTVSSYLYWSKSGGTNFNNLTGYVIFAYPQVKLIRQKDTIDVFINPIYSAGKILPATLSSYRKGSLFPKKVLESENSGNFDDVKAGMLPTIILKQNLNDRDPVRSWIAKFVTEDTIYFGYKSEIDILSEPNTFIGGRLSRWQFALEIYKQEYNWWKKLLGGGYDYLNWYGYYFHRDKMLSDWPHNPFLSVLLYSGVIGLLFYIFMMYKVFYYYWKYRKEYPLFGIFFMITFYFSFFSANAPFDPPLMGFFVLLPFFIHNVHSGKSNVSKTVVDTYD